MYCCNFLFVQGAHTDSDGDSSIVLVGLGNCMLWDWQLSLTAVLCVLQELAARRAVEEKLMLAMEEQKLQTMQALQHEEELLAHKKEVSECWSLGTLSSSTCHPVQGHLAPFLGQAQQQQEHCYPFLSVCVVFSCVQTMVLLPVFEIFNLRTDVDAYAHVIARRSCRDTVRESEAAVPDPSKVT